MRIARTTLAPSYVPTAIALIGLFLTLLTGSQSLPAAPAADQHVVTSVAELRGLPQEEARRGRSVRVKGIVTYQDEQWRTLFIQQDDAGCFIYRTNQSPALQVGQVVEIEGRTVPGYVNAIGEQGIRIIGTAPLPESTPATFERLLSGVEDSQRVRVRSVIRSMAVEFGRLILDFGEGRGRFEAHLPAYTGTRLPTNLLDAIVEITGVAGANLTPADHLVGVRLFVPSLNDIRVLTPSRSDPFVRAPQTIESLFWVNPRSAAGQRLAVTGAVTLASPSGKLFLSDGSGHLQVKLETPRTRTDPKGLYLDPPVASDLQPGDHVLVLGYPALGDYLPVLQDAWVQKLGRGEPARSRQVTAELALTGRFDGNLVTLHGRLIGRESRPMGTTMDQVLTIQSEHVIFEARLENAPEIDLPIASTVSLTGVCVVQADEQRKARAFRLLLRSPHDVIILQHPPRWSAEHVVRGLVVTLAVLAGAIGWLVLLRRRVRFQEERISGLRREAHLQHALQQLNAELERRIAERTAELSQSEERFSKAFASNPAILSILRLPEARYVDVNETFLRTYGFTREEVLGRTSDELNLWQDPAARAQLMAEVHAGRPVHNRESRYRTKAGAPRIVLQSLESITIDGERCLLAVGQDITESKRVEAALAERETHTRLIIDNALDAVITIDAAGAIRGWNPHAEVIFGWKKEEIVGRDLAETLIPTHYRQAHRRGMQHFLKTGEGPVLNRRIELTALRKDGHDFPAELAITALQVGDSYIFSAFVRDITDRRRAEEELLRALEREKELGKLKSNFVTMVSHEFRTPLGIIMSSEEILDRYFDRLTPDKRREQLQAIHGAVKRMAEMMEEILLLGRVEAGKMEYHPVPLDLPVFIRKVIDEIQAASALRCPIEFLPGPLPDEVPADEGLLRHILINLLSNAIKYSPPGEAVHLTVREERGQVVFTIEDHGVGIPETDQAWLFKAFHRGQNVGNLPGTGLGLTIVKRCVELHGGKIKFHSTTGIGTTFIVTLPLTATPVEVGAETAFFMNRP